MQRVAWLVVTAVLMLRWSSLFEVRGACFDVLTN
jgi:hypothetical protein